MKFLYDKPNWYKQNVILKFSKCSIIIEFRGQTVGVVGAALGAQSMKIII